MAYQKKVKEEYEKMGYIVVSVVRLSVNGYPDLLCMKDGKCIWIECKEGKDTLKPLQRYRIDELRKNGFEAFATHKEKGIIY